MVILTGWGEKAACTSAYLSGPEITDELVKVLRRRLDEATLDIITVMLVRNCKLTPADVEVPHQISALLVPEPVTLSYFLTCLSLSCPRAGQARAVCCIPFPAPVLAQASVHRGIYCMGARVGGRPPLLGFAAWQGLPVNNPGTSAHICLRVLSMDSVILPTTLFLHIASWHNLDQYQSPRASC